jgi:hypothetical protein
MIRITEALQLAKTKFKTRKVRNILSAVTISLGIILILAALIGSNGVMSAAGEAFKDTNANRYFVRDSGFVYSSEGAMMNKLEQPVSRFPAYSKEQYKNENSSAGIKNIYDEISVNGRTFQLSGISSAPEMPYTLTSSEDDFIVDYFYNEYSFDDSYDGKIPVIVPIDQIIKLDGVKLPSGSKERYEAILKLTDKYAGKTVKLTSTPGGVFGMPVTDESGQAEQMTPVSHTTDFIIVGFSTMLPYAYSPLDSSYVIPLWAQTKNDELKGLFQNKQYSYIVEFGSKKQRDDYSKAKMITSSVSPIMGRMEMFTEPMNILRNIAYGIGGFLLAISSLFVLSTLSKIVSDSKREIGVFRAVGGQRRDIRKIFFSYTFLLVTLGYLVGLIVALLLTTGASMIWGDKSFYSIAQFATTPVVSKPALMFVEVPALPVLALYGFVLLIGFIAALIPVIRASRMDPIKALREE